MVKSIITVTEKAANYIRAEIAKGKEDNKDYIGLRVGITKGGCSGSKYDFSYAEDRKKFDEVVEDKGITLFIDPAATFKIIGSEMDYEESQFKSGLVFRNPNESAKCGCGESIKFD